MTERMGPGTAAVVLERDNGQCRRCDQRGDEIHHRRGKGMGGTSLSPHNLARLVLLCGDCHRWVEKHRAEGYATGWAVRRSSPAHESEIPLERPDGALVWLYDDGSVAYGRPREEG